MADESEADLFADSRRPPPRELTRLSPRVRRLVAPNASAFTFNGTCTYLVGEGAVAVVDPGPADPMPSRRDPVCGRGRAGRDDPRHPHPPGPQRPRQRSAGGDRRPHRGPAPFEPKGDGPARLSHDRAYAPDAVLADGERLASRGFTIEAVATPGHCGDHLCLALLEERALFSGDHVMAWSTSVVAPPDGSMGAYMASLEKVRARDETIYWPGHGGPVLDPQRYVRALALHRRQREASILAALEAGAETVPELVAQVYVGLDPSLRRAAGLSTLAHLEDLGERGLIVADGARPEPRFRRA